MESEWSACPPDILQRCLGVQEDYNDNAAAACVNKLWRNTFRCGGHAIDLLYSSLRPPPSNSYLQQFSHVTSVTLHRCFAWQPLQTWLANSVEEGSQYIEPAVWAGTLSQINPACSNLTLDHYLPKADALNDFQASTLTQSLSQLTNLRQLTMHQERRAEVPIDFLSEQTKLQVLQVSGRLPWLRLVGSLGRLPSSLTRLQLSCCQDLSNEGTYMMVIDLTHLQHLKDVDLGHSAACFGPDFRCGGLSMLTRLVLSRFFGPVGLHKDVFQFTALQVLILRRWYVQDQQEQNGLPLDDILSHLTCLRELDVIDCSSVSIAPADCKVMKLFSFSFKYGQLHSPDKCFQHFLLDKSAPAGSSQPFLRMDARPFAVTAFQAELPFWPLTHLTISSSLHLPNVFDALNASGLQQLRVLDIDFCSSRKPAMLNMKVKLKELYIAGSECCSYDFAQCTSLRSLNIIHNDARKPALALPPFLTRLCLHNTLAASTDPGLHNLNDLVSVKLGGKTADKDSTRQLPILPCSTVELDLWDGLLNDLQQLTRLTNLKKLSVLDPPTEQQLQMMRQLRLLKWLNVTGRAGMHTRSGRIINPWRDQ